MGAGSREAEWAALWAGRIVVLDVETTGFQAEGDDRVVQVAMILLDNGAETWRWCSLVNPGRDTGPVHIHGISSESVADSPTFAGVMDTISQALSGSRAIAAHNATFDLRFLRAEFARAGAALPDLPVIDTRLLARTLGLDMASEQLPDVAAAYGIAHANPHDALADADVTVAVLVRELSDGFAQQGWRSLEQVAKIAPPEQYAGRSRNGGSGLSITIDLDNIDLAEVRASWEAKEAARKARLTPEQHAVWNEFHDVRYTDPGPTIELIDRACQLWPAGDPDLVDILTSWQLHCGDAFNRARSNNGKAERAPAVIQATELLWSHQAEQGICARDAAHHSQAWAAAVAALPHDQALAAYTAKVSSLIAWPLCGTCDICRNHPHARSWDTDPILEVVLPLTTVDSKTASLKQKREQVAAQWAAAFAAAGDLSTLEGLTRRRISVMESLEQYQAAVDIGWEAIEAGVTHPKIADRMGLIYERKLGDPAKALEISELALTWPEPVTGRTAQESIRKRLNRVQKRA